MQYLNPYELLEIAPNADENSVKKAKRRRMADLDLNEGYITLGKHKVYKSEFIQLSQALEDPEQAKYYGYVLGNLPLHRFLSDGSLDFFKNHTKQAIFEDKKFLTFIGPFFAAQYDRCLSKAFKAKDWTTVQLLGSGPVLVGTPQMDKAYEGTVRHWQQFHQDCKAMLEELNEEEDSYETQKIDALMQRLDQEQWIKGLNLLPSFFQNQRNELAQTLRSLSVGVFNNLDDVERAYQIIQQTQQLQLSGLIENKVKEDVKQLGEIQQKRESSKAFEHILKPLGTVVQSIAEAEKAIKQGGDKDKMQQLLNVVIHLVDVEQLNALPEELAAMRQTIAFALRNLSVTIFNELHRGDTALKVLNIALSIKLNAETRKGFEKDRKDLTEAIQGQEQMLKNLLSFAENLVNQFKNLGKDQTINEFKVVQILTKVYSPELLHAVDQTFSSQQKARLEEALISVAAYLGREAKSVIAAMGAIFSDRPQAFEQRVIDAEPPLNVAKLLVWIAIIFFILIAFANSK